MKLLIHFKLMIILSKVYHKDWKQNLQHLYLISINIFLNTILHLKSIQTFNL